MGTSHLQGSLSVYGVVYRPSSASNTHFPHQPDSRLQRAPLDSVKRADSLPELNFSSQLHAASISQVTSSMHHPLCQKNLRPITSDSKRLEHIFIVSCPTNILTVQLQPKSASTTYLPLIDAPCFAVVICRVCGAEERSPHSAIETFGKMTTWISRSPSRETAIRLESSRRWSSSCRPRWVSAELGQRSTSTTEPQRRNLPGAGLELLLRHFFNAIAAPPLVFENSAAVGSGSSVSASTRRQSIALSPVR